MVEMRKIIGLVIGVCLCFLFFSGNATAGYNDTVKDGTGDVWHCYWTETTDIQTSYNHERPNIDITQVSMSESGGNVTVTMKVKGTITDSWNIEYCLRIVDDNGTPTINDDSTYYIQYGVATETVFCNLLWSDKGSTLLIHTSDLSDNTTHSGGTLTTHFQLSDIGNPGQLRFATDEAGAGYASEYVKIEETYQEWYEDSVTDEEAEEGEITGGEEEERGRNISFASVAVCCTIVIVIAAVIIVAVIMLIRRRKTLPPPATPPVPPSQPPYIPPPTPPQSFQLPYTYPAPPQQPPTKITIQCPSCGTPGKVDPSFHGNLRCPACHTMFEV